MDRERALEIVNGLWSRQSGVLKLVTYGDCVDAILSADAEARRAEAEHWAPVVREFLFHTDDIGVLDETRDLARALLRDHEEAKQ